MVANKVSSKSKPMYMYDGCQAEYLSYSSHEDAKTYTRR